MNETLRLFPTVPLNSRRSIVDTTLPRGGGPDGQAPVFVPKGTEVNYSVYAMHRNKAIWGPKANEFIPARWDGLKSGFEYLPFNGGPRCVIFSQLHGSGTLIESTEFALANNLRLLKQDT